MPAFVSEIFSSVQGEGVYAGCRQVFIRLAGCNLRCAYCDTPLPPDPGQCRVELSPGRRDFAQLNNPLTEEQAAETAHSFDLSLHHSVSLTGGEPLLHPHFLEKLAPLLQGTRRGIYLETNGTLTEGLARIIGLVDIIAMDIKLPSVTGLSPMWKEHGRFLEVARWKETFVKIVVGGNTTKEEIEKAVLLVRSAAKDIPLVLQPVTPAGDVEGILPERLHDFQKLAMQELADVRVIPQTHKIIGQL